MKIKTWEILQQESVHVLGKDAGLLFINLRAQLHDIEWRWNEYVVLFGTKESRINLLNEAAPAFFGHLQDTLFADVLLHIARITDSPKSVGKLNLTIRALPQHFSEAAINLDLQSLITSSLSATEFCRDWRNKRLAHADLGYFTEQHPVSLKEATREKVNIAIETIRCVLNRVSLQYFQQELHPVSDVVIGGALDLLYKIDDAKLYELARRQRFESGKILPEDTEIREI